MVITLESRVFSQPHKEPNPDYDFYEVDSRHDSTSLNPYDGIIFNEFDSIAHGWWLASRDLSTPEEKEITESVPYQQGEWDFSSINGERFYKNRTIKYEFYIVNEDPQYRQGELQSAKRELIYTASNKLYDTGFPPYYFTGKVKSISDSDDNEKGIMTVTIQFDSYPYAFVKDLEGSDIWDDIDFDHYCESQCQFNIDSITTNEIRILNPDKPVLVKPVISGEVNIFPAGYKTPINTSGTMFTLKHGVNSIQVNGSGTLELQWRREVMI